MAALDDPSKQADLYTAVERCGNVKDAARLIGLTRQTIGAYMRKHPDVKLEVEAAAHRHRVLAHNGPRMLTTANPASTDGDGPQLDQPATVDKVALLTLLLEHAQDGQSRGCAKSLGILAELAFAPELLAMRAEAKRAEQVSGAGDQRPIVIRVPDRSQRPSPRAAIDAEVVG